MLDRSTFWTQIGIGIDSMFMQVMPIFILSILTMLIILKLKEVRERRKTLNMDSESGRADQTGSALLAIVILFLICEVPIASLVFACIFDFRILRNVVARVNTFSFMLRLLNSSLNFILYCIMSSQFRSEFTKTFLNAKVKHVLSLKMSNKLATSGYKSSTLNRNGTLTKETRDGFVSSDV